MSLKKMKFKRPTCESCGAKIYPKINPFITANFLFGDLPSYCPNCGKEISNEKNAQVAKYTRNVYGLWCILFLVFVIVVIIIFSSL